jgi:hypothetical protein
MNIITNLLLKISDNNFEAKVVQAYNRKVTKLLKLLMDFNAINISYLK